MRLAIMDFSLSPCEADVLPAIRQFNAHFLTNFFEDLRRLLQLQCIRIANSQHGIFMALLSTNGHCAAIRSCANHFQGEIGIVTMYADENARFNLIAPNGEIGMIRIDHFFRVNFRIH